VLSFCCIVSFYYNDLYDLRVTRNFAQFASRLVRSFGVAFVLVAIFYTLFPATKMAGGPFLVSCLSIIGFLLPLRAISYAVMRSRPFMERVLVLGTSPLAFKLIREIEARPHFRYAVAAVVDDANIAGALPARIPFRGPLEHVDKIIDELRPHRIVVALSDRRGHLPLPQLLEARVRGIPVEDGAQMYERLAGKLAIEALTPSNLIFSGHFRKSYLDLAAGRAISLLASFTGMILLSPLLGLVALLIKMESVGPVFFVQERVGMAAKHFRLIKFRTMRLVDTRTSEWACDNTQRITRIGKWLRKFRVDELPQFFNVIRGDMNLVGPRPHPVSNFELFVENIPYYPLRSVVRPGITGWAQVRFGYANNLDEETEKMRYDLYYIKHLSVWFDLRILFDTIKIVLFGQGSDSANAYGAEATIVVRAMNEPRSTRVVRRSP
jgi:exopolysaccharide biosynthesis polyprenyl glycosylphosphotransferase